ncbi:MAG TPA: hypothetical protein VFY93_00515 [Planctomycetota bacterium]|nr:hypothetical protein [Planctomycetota bacterium]
MRNLVIALSLVTFACGGKEEAKAPASAAPVVDLALPADPGEALSVLEAKKKGSGEEVLVVGRVKDIVKGFSTFNLTDLSFKYCGEVPGSMTDKTPWDYCCDPADEVAAATLTVEARGPDGRPLRGAMPSLRLLDLVVVKGRVEKDEHGNVTIIASGWFGRERPDLPGGLHWPE